MFSSRRTFLLGDIRLNNPSPFPHKHAFRSFPVWFSFYEKSPQPQPLSPRTPAGSTEFRASPAQTISTVALADAGNAAAAVAARPRSARLPRLWKGGFPRGLKPQCELRVQDGCRFTKMSRTAPVCSSHCVETKSLSAGVDICAFVTMSSILSHPSRTSA